MDQIEQLANPFHTLMRVFEALADATADSELVAATSRKTVQGFRLPKIKLQPEPGTGSFHPKVSGHQADETVIRLSLR